MAVLFGGTQLNSGKDSKRRIAERIPAPRGIFRRRSQEVACLIVAACVLIGIAIPLRAQASAASEYQVKA
ncbi:MAG: hypothetical protein WBC04_25930 [Candidatus Acidiferrales bacterium]